MYSKGDVLPFTREDEETINKQIKASKPSLVQIARDLEHFIRVGLLGILKFPFVKICINLY